MAINQVSRGSFPKDLSTRKRAEEGCNLPGNGKPAPFDVFLCHNSADAKAVLGLGELLRARGLRPWISTEQLRPGIAWHLELERVISRIRTVAILVGSNGRGPWQNREIGAFLREFVRRGCPMIPVILPGSTVMPRLPVFLKEFVWVDFRREDPDPLAQLIWGITGKRLP